MKVLPRNKDTFLQTVLQVLPTDYQEQAYEQGAFTRSRKLSSPEQLFELVMSYCCLDYSLRTCAGHLALNKTTLTDTAVMKRLLPCLPWLKSLLSSILSKKLVHHHLNSPYRFLAIDGSTIQVKGARSTSYRLHLAMDLITLSQTHIKVTDAHQGENLNHYDLAANDVVLLDRGYNQPKTLVPFIEKGGHVVLRYHAKGMTLFHPQPDSNSLQRIDWLDEIKKIKENSLCKEVVLRCQDRTVKGYVHLSRLSKAHAEKAHRDLRRSAQRQQYTASERAFILADWMFVFTTLPPDILDTKTVMLLYRTRWQIELVFKRLKTLLSLTKLRAKQGSALAEIYLYGKLLYAVMLECYLRQFVNVQAYYLYQEKCDRLETPWRLWHLFHQQLMACLTVYLSPSDIPIDTMQKALRERKRKRQLQTIPSHLIRNPHKTTI